MKIWLKVVFGILLGLGAGLLLSATVPDAGSTLAFLSTLVLRIGRSIAVPLFFFSTVIAIYQLAEDKCLARSLLPSLGISIAFNVGLTLVGIVAFMAINPARLPILTDIQPEAPALTFRSFFLKLFPDNFLTLLSSSEFLLPSGALALLLGVILVAERANAKPLVTFFDSLSRMSYHINNFFVEFLPVGLIVLAADFVFQMKQIPAPGMYAGLLALIGGTILALVLVFIPALLWFLCGRKNPYRWLYALLAPALTALVSRDINFSYGSLVKHGKESLGIRRRANAVGSGVAITLGRAGSTMVAAISFLMILKSYSNLGVSLQNVFWVLGTSLVVSLLLGSVPGSGSFAAITVLCGMFGKGYEASYLIIKPIALPLIALGAAFDIVVAGVVNFLAARVKGAQEDRETRFFI